MGRASDLRFLLGLLALAVGLTFACAGVLVLAHWTPHTSRREVYDWAFMGHAAPSVLLLPALALFLSEFGDPPRAWKPSWLLPLAWVSLGIGALATIAAIWLRLPRISVGLALWLPCLVVAALVFPRVTEVPRVRNLVLVLASFVQLAGVGLSVPFGQANFVSALAEPFASGLGNAFIDWALDVTALAALVSALGESAERRVPALPVAVLALAPIVPAGSLVQVPVSLAVFTSAGWLLAVALGRRRVPRGIGELLFTSLAALLLLESVSFGHFLGLVRADIHLHDTYFVTGVFHLRAATCLLAVIAVTHCYRPGPGRGPMIYASAALSALGSQLMCIAMLFVGARGMPLRYVDYLPEFQPWHRAIAVGGGLLILGVILALVDAFGKRSAQVSNPRPFAHHG